jgi:hypothetical protein
MVDHSAESTSRGVGQFVFEGKAVLRVDDSATAALISFTRCADGVRGMWPVSVFPIRDGERSPDDLSSVISPYWLVTRPELLATSQKGFSANLSTNSIQCGKLPGTYWSRTYSRRSECCFQREVRQLRLQLRTVRLLVRSPRIHSRLDCTRTVPSPKCLGSFSCRQGVAFGMYCVETTWSDDAVKMGQLVKLERIKYHRVSQRLVIYVATLSRHPITQTGGAMESIAVGTFRDQT